MRIIGFRLTRRHNDEESQTGSSISQIDEGKGLSRFQNASSNYQDYHEGVGVLGRIETCLRFDGLISSLLSSSLHSTTN